MGARHLYALGAAVTDLLSDDELDVAIDAAHRQWLRLIRARARRRYSKTIAADPEINQRKFSPEVRKKMSDSQRGKTRTPEQRAAIRAGILAYHERRRALQGLA